MPANQKKLSISQLSEITGIDRSTISKKLSDVPFSEGTKGAKMYDRNVAMPLLFGNTAPQGEDEAKKRKAIAEAEKAELVVKRLKGELVSVSAMTEAAGELVKTLYMRVVRVEPAVIASKAVGKSAIEIETICREQLSIVFNELKTMTENFLTIEDTVDEIVTEDGEDGD
jgi:hypothetical protein